MADNTKSENLLKQQIFDVISKNLTITDADILRNIFEEHANYKKDNERLVSENENLQYKICRLNDNLENYHKENNELRAELENLYKTKEHWETIEKKYSEEKLKIEKASLERENKNMFSVLSLVFKSDVYRHHISGQRMEKMNGCMTSMPFEMTQTDSKDVPEHVHFISENPYEKVTKDTITQ